ncbi:MAG: hypothetical protein AAF465_08545 [Pseudomonadota bacterium]
MHTIQTVFRLLALCTVVLLGAVAGCSAEIETIIGEPGLEAKSARDYSIEESTATSIPMGGFIEFNERVEIDATTGYGNCFYATYEFRFEYDASVFVEFRDGTNGHCSFGAILVRSFEVRVLAEEDYPLGAQLSPFIQFHQSDPHIAVFQIGREYFAERISDLREVEISCRRDSCDGMIQRRVANSI